jgi:hypothetical protein
VADGADETLRMPTLVASGSLGENGNRSGFNRLGTFATGPGSYQSFRILEHFLLLLLLDGSSCCRYLGSHVFVIIGSARMGMGGRAPIRQRRLIVVVVVAAAAALVLYDRNNWIVVVLGFRHLLFREVIEIGRQQLTAAVVVVVV